MIKIIEGYDPQVDAILNKTYRDMDLIEERVKEIITQVRKRGNDAVLEYTATFDGARLTPQTLRVSQGEIEEAYGLVDEEFLVALRAAKENIAAFHAKQLTKSWFEPEGDGTVLGQLHRPLARVGIYVPGGTACYPSSVLMNALPAKVAGVKEIVMVAPPARDGKMNPCTLVAAAESGVTEIYKIGGAQAVAALAYGTQTIRKVDKITGPGNIYVTVAKKQVFGQVDIDMLAGPSEILIIADSSANPRYLAADLLSQAEHDVLASAVLITPDRELAREVQKEVERQTNLLPRKKIIMDSLNAYGAIIITPDLAEAVKLANRYAPEHLEIAVEQPFAILGQIANAGAVFLGHYSPEPVGDYFAGPNHVLPTGGTARFYSPLNVDTFMKKTSVIYYSRERLAQVGSQIVKLAETEGLDAHANAVKVRMDDNE